MRNKLLTLLFTCLFFMTCKYSVKNKQNIPIDTVLEMEEDIEIEPDQYTYKEIEDLYLNYKISGIQPNLDSIQLHLKHYFIEMERGIHPFELKESIFLDELKIDTLTLRLFLEDLQIKIKNKL